MLNGYLIMAMNLFNVPIWLNILIQALILSFMISPKSLAKAGRDIYDKLMQNDISSAREKVNYIVSRDVNRMNEADITRATVETVAENTVDGIISPLFFFFIGGSSLSAVRPPAPSRFCRRGSGMTRPSEHAARLPASGVGRRSLLLTVDSFVIGR